MDCCRLLGEIILERILQVTFDCPQHAWIQDPSQSHTHIPCCPRQGRRLQQVGPWPSCLCLSLSFGGRLVQSVPVFHRMCMLHHWLGTCCGNGHLRYTRYRISLLLTSCTLIWHVWQFLRPISLWLLNWVLCIWRINLSVTGFFKPLHCDFYGFIFSHKFQTIFNRHFPFALSFRFQSLLLQLCISLSKIRKVVFSGNSAGRYKSISPHK